MPRPSRAEGGVQSNHADLLAAVRCADGQVESASHQKSRDGLAAVDTIEQRETRNCQRRRIAASARSTKPAPERQMTRDIGQLTPLSAENTGRDGGR
jgi:hypothetical protein